MALIDDLGAKLRRASSGVLPHVGGDHPSVVTASNSGAAWRPWAVRLRRIFGPLMAAGLPKGLFARSILIVVMPMIILQSVVAYVFMERHWQMVTRRLSNALARDIAAIVEVIETYPQDPRFAQITELSADTYGLTISVLPAAPLPEPGPKPFFSLLDSTLSDEIKDKVGRPFWIDTLGTSDMVEIRVALADHVLRVFAPRNRAYASNTAIFLLWMVGTALVLMTIALLFLRNQIKPILNLAHAADEFGKGHPAPVIQTRGAREVRQATEAFNDMRRRIERQIEQRTTMLSGVSHDLRTILTRFKLELELLGDLPDTEAIRADVDEMSRMLEDYLAFAQGDAGEAAAIVDVQALLEELAQRASRDGASVETGFEGEPEALTRPMGLRRCLANLVGNAGKHADRIALNGRHADGWLTITVDDDGPGIPPEEREAVFRPFFRLDASRNLATGGVGLGLTIARDVARGHGGDVVLETSPQGGLRARVHLPR